MKTAGLLASIPDIKVADELNGADQQIEELYREEQTIIGIDLLTDELTNSQRLTPPHPTPLHPSRSETLDTGYCTS